MSAEKRKSPPPSGQLKRRTTNVDIETDFPTTVLSAIPSIYQFLPFTDLVPYDSYENKCVLGQIVHAYPVRNRPRNGHLRKLLMVDAYRKNGTQQNRARLTVFLFDDFALASDNYGEGSMLAVSNFHTESLTYEDPDSETEILPIQVLVMVSPSGDDGPHIWLANKKLLSNGKEVSPDKIIDPTREKLEKEMEVDEENEDYDSDSVENVNGLPVPETSNRCYNYTKLEDVDDSNRKAIYNIYGLVERCKMHLNQVRKAYSWHLHLSDQTKSDFSCTISGGKTDVLVDVNVGDVIRIHRMMVETVRGRLRGKCLSPKFVVVFDKNSREENPKSVAKTFVYTDEDKAIVRRLFSWGEVTKKKFICEIKKEEFVDFYCQVIGVYVAKLSNAVVLTVWDGTKTTEFKSEHRGYSDEKIDHDLFEIARDHFVTLFVYGNYGLVAGDLMPGMYVEVKDAQLHCPKSNLDNPLLVIHPQQKDRRGIFVLDPSDNRIDSLKRRLQKVTEDFQQNPNRKNPEGDEFFLNCNVKGFSSQTSDTSANHTESSTQNQDSEADDENLDSNTINRVPGSVQEELTLASDGKTHEQDTEAPENDNIETDDSTILETTLVPFKEKNTSNDQEHENSHQVLEYEVLEPKNMAPEVSTLSQKEFITESESHDINIAASSETVPTENSGLNSRNIHPDTANMQKQSNVAALKSPVVPLLSLTSSSTSMTSNEPVVSRNNMLDNKGKVISVINASIEPGHSTQEFGGVYREITRRQLAGSEKASETNASSALNAPQSSTSYTSQQVVQTAVNQDSLMRPTQFQGFGPAPKYNLFGQSILQVQDNTTEVIEEWWKNMETITVTLGHSNVKPSTLVEITNHSVPYKFRAIAVALKVKPETTSIRKLIRLYCAHCHLLTDDADPELDIVDEKDGLPLYSCPQCSSSTSDKTSLHFLIYTYLITFSLHDGSQSSIDAFLWKENAVKFFNGISPNQSLLDKSVADSVFSMLWKICPNSRPLGSSSGITTSENKLLLYPIMDCCLMSYTAGGMTRYQMFDTKVL